LDWPDEITPELLKSRFIVNFPRPLFENRRKAQYFLDEYFPEGYPWIIKGRTYKAHPDSLISRLKQPMHRFKNN
jgi:hypothetical protein